MSDFHQALGGQDFFEAIDLGEEKLFSSDGFDPKVETTWMQASCESGQTVKEFIESDPNRVDDERDTVYIQPFGSWDWLDKTGPDIEALEGYLEIFFGCRVKTLPLLGFEAEDYKITARINPFDNRRQFLTRDILNLLIRRLPDDAFTVIGLSNEDLYPDPNWNYLFGQASIKSRVAICSFARYTEENSPKLTLKRTLKVMAHEIGHTYGMLHCTYFGCAMNGSNDLADADSRPMHLRPVCLRKLHWSTGIDLVERYAGLREFYQKYGYREEADFVTHRIGLMRDKVDGRRKLAKEFKTDDGIFLIEITTRYRGVEETVRMGPYFSKGSARGACTHKANDIESGNRFKSEGHETTLVSAEVVGYELTEVNRETYIEEEDGEQD